MTVEKKRFSIPIGPQHPALKEPGHFEFFVEGETVVDATARLGYAHRGIEKATESRNWTQNMYLLERICGICSHIHAMAYATAVEQLADVEIPPRAQAIRVLLAEMERIHSHLLWLGVTAHEGGFDTLFMVSWRDREVILDALETLTGNRVNFSVNLLGGVKADVTPEISEQILQAVAYLETRSQHYLDIVTGDAAFLQRTSGVGIMSRDRAERLGVVGPTARGSGIARDMRIDAPYLAYDQFPVNIILDDSGDLSARCAVRVRELLEACRLIRDILEHLPEGDLTTRMKRRLPEGEAMLRVEAPRGELFYYVRSEGGTCPARVRVRTPTLNNMASVLALSIGQQLADIPMILVGIDPCFSCNDRMMTLCDSHGDRTLTWSALRQHGIDVYRQKGGAS